MDPDLENVIRQALGDAQAAGRDHLGSLAARDEAALAIVASRQPVETARLANLWIDLSPAYQGWYEYEGR